MSTPILLIAYDFHPFVGSGGSVRMVKLAKYLHRLDQPLVVLTGGFESRDADQSLDHELTGIPIEVASTNPVMPNIIDHANRASSLRLAGRILRTFLPFPDNRFRYLPAMFTAARKLIHARGIRTVLITSPPNSMSLLVPLLRYWRKELRLVLDFRDSWALDPQMSPNTSWFRWTQRMLEHLTVNQADLVITCTPGLDKWIQSQLKRPSTAHLITNGYDEEDFPSNLPESPRDGRFLLTYAGSIGGVNGPHSLQKMMEAMQLLEKRRGDLACRLVLQIAGHVSPIERDRVAGLLTTSRMEFLGFLPHRQALEIQAASHAILIMLFEKPNVDRVYTGKLFEACRLAKPLLVSAPPGILADFVTSRDMGEVTPATDADAICRGIERLMDRCLNGPSYPLPIMDLAQFERGFLARRYLELLKS
jgi:glycosyltransferase involved in cell wall biosynthesis